MPIFLAVALAAGFVAAFRFGPLVVLPLALAGGLLVFILGIRPVGSTPLGIVAVIVAINVGFLAGAIVARRLSRSDRLRTCLPRKRFMR